MQKSSFILPREALFSLHKNSTTITIIHTSEKTETYPVLSSPKSL